MTKLDDGVVHTIVSSASAEPSRNAKLSITPWSYRSTRRSLVEWLPVSRESDVIYELRIYRSLPGQMPRLLDRFDHHTTKIWERLGIRAVGFWITTIGGSEGGELVYMLAWVSLGERERLWAEFQTDAGWQQVKSQSESQGPIVENIDSQILAPTAFSAMR